MTVLSEVHAAAAEQGVFSGWVLPAVYTSTDKEFDAARNAAGMADLSLFGRITASGKDALDLLHRLSTNNLLGLSPGKIGDTILVTDKGRLVDYVEIWMRPSSFLMRVSPGREETILHWIEKYTINEDITLEVVTSSTAEVFLIGPNVESIMNDVHITYPGEGETIDIRGEGGTLMLGRVQQDQTPILRAMGEPHRVLSFWKQVAAAGLIHGLRPMGMRAYEALRISLGIPAAAHEITESYNPYEAGLKKAISFTKGCYVGQEVIARLDTYQKVKRKLIGVVLSSPVAIGEKRVAVRKGENDVGWLTSSAMHPVHAKFIGLAIADENSVREGDALDIAVPNGAVHAVAINLPMFI